MVVLVIMMMIESVVAVRGSGKKIDAMQWCVSQTDAYLYHGERKRERVFIR